MMCTFSGDYNPCSCCMNPCYNDELETHIESFSNVVNLQEFLEDNPHIVIQSISVIKQPNSDLEIFLLVYISLNQN